MKKIKLTLVSLLLAFAMVFAVACGSDNGGSGSGTGTGAGSGNDPTAANYLALYNRAVALFENDADFDEVFNMTRAQLLAAGFPADELPAGLLRLAFADNFTTWNWVSIALFDTNANADAAAAEMLEDAIEFGEFAGRSGRVLFGSDLRELVELIIDEIGGTELT